MARIHSHRRGKSHSTRPASKRPPSWVNYSQDEITAAITKYSKEGLGASQIGLKMRDEYAIPSTKTFLGKSIKQVLPKGSTPEDLTHLVERAAKLKAHLNSHHADRKNVRSLELLEAKIHRISNYYKNRKELPIEWKYSAAVAQLA